MIKSFSGHSLKIQLATNTLSQFTGKIFSAGSTFIISILIARMYGPSGYGDFTKITAFVALFYLLADFGVNAVYLKEEASASHPVSWLDLLVVRGVLSGLALFLALSISVFLPGSNTLGYPAYIKLGIILYLPTIVLQGFITSANAVFQKHLRYDLGAIAVGIGSILSCILVYMTTQIILPERALFIIILSIIAGLTMSAILSLKLASDRNPLGVLHIGIWKRLLIASLPMGLTLATNTIYFRADSIILTLTRSVTEVGLYGFAYKLFEFPLVIPTFIANSVYPVFLKRLHEGHDGHESFWRAVKKTLVVLFISSLPITIFAWFCAQYIPLIRPEFSGSIQALRILSIGIPVFFVSAGLLWAHIALGNRWFIFWTYLAGMVGNVGINVLLIPTYGYLSASVVTVISEIMIICITASHLRTVYGRDTKILRSS